MEECAVFDIEKLEEKRKNHKIILKTGENTF